MMPDIANFVSAFAAENKTALLVGATSIVGLGVLVAGLTVFGVRPEVSEQPELVEADEETSIDDDDVSWCDIDNTDIEAAIDEAYFDEIAARRAQNDDISIIARDLGIPVSKALALLTDPRFVATTVLIQPPQLRGQQGA